LLLEFGEMTLEGVELFAELLELGWSAVFLEGLQDACGVPVESLTGEALLLGASGDVAVRPLEDGGGMGDTELRG
jgi:hypothetical protein